MDSTDGNKTKLLFDIAHQCLISFDRVAASHDAALLTRSLKPDDTTKIGRRNVRTTFDFLGLKNSFSFWIHKTGALSLGKSSLDQRLHGLENVSSMIVELLEMILENLHRVDANPESGTAAATEACTPAQQVFLSTWDHACRIIDAGIDRLDTMAIAIRKVSARQLDQSISTILTEEDMAFRKDIASLVRYRFPAARKVLCLQLADCIAARRLMLLQTKRHSTRLAVRRPLSNKDKADHLNPAQPTKRRDKDGSISYPTVITGLANDNLPYPRVPSLERLDASPKKAPPTLVSAMFTAKQDSFIYPPFPKVTPGETCAHCPFCFTALEIESSEEENMNNWRRHIDQDVKPYGCLFPQCSRSLVFFVHRRDWELHMESVHSKDWLRKVHALTWFCDFGHDPPVMFETELLWKEHMLDPKSHPSRKRVPTQFQIDALSSQRRRIVPREQFVCPLCERVPDELSQMVAKSEGEVTAMHNILVSHVASHIKSLSLMALPSLEVSTEEIRDNDNDSLVFAQDTFQKPLNPESIAQPPRGRGQMENDPLTSLPWSVKNRGSIASPVLNDHNMTWDDEFHDYVQPEAPPESADEHWLEEWALWKKEDDPALHAYPENDPILNHFQILQKPNFGVNTQDRTRTELSLAAQFGDIDAVNRLLTLGVDINLADQDGQTPLLWAAYKGHEAIVRLLVKNAARVEKVDQVYGRTPLSWAASKGHQDVVRLLLRNGANVNAVDNSQRTPLSWAASRGHLNTVRYLIEAGADKELADSRSGQTPLSWAVSRGQEAVVKLLLKQGVGVDTLDESHRTKTSWAAE
ncbi:hypothetical protein SNK03_004001 [Fusarium graminearum]